MRQIAVSSVTACVGSGMRTARAQEKKELA